MVEGGEAGPPKKRFVQLTDEDIEEKTRQLYNSNTEANEVKAVKCFKKYLESNNVENTDSFTYTEAKLDRWLKRFYWNACKSDNEMYTTGSMNTMRYGFNRALRKYGHNFDITKYEFTSFTESIKTFDEACKELKQHGKGFVKSYKEILQTHK